MICRVAVEEGQAVVFRPVRRDGNRVLLHSNCWTTRHRAAGRGRDTAGLHRLRPPLPEGPGPLREAAARPQVLERGYEGLVAKDDTSPYVGGPTRSWLKVKQANWTQGEHRWRRTPSVQQDRRR